MENVLKLNLKIKQDIKVLKMTEKKEKPEAEMTDLEYLQHSKEVFEDMLTKNLERIKAIQKDIAEVQADIKNMTNERLIKASMNAHNQLAMEKGQRLKQVKEIRADLIHVRSIMKILRNKGKK